MCHIHAYHRGQTWSGAVSRETKKEIQQQFKKTWKRRQIDMESFHSSAAQPKQLYNRDFILDFH